jgi:hypothetical protein
MLALNKDHAMNWLFDKDFDFTNESSFLENEWNHSMTKLNEELLQLISSSSFVIAVAQYCIIFDSITSWRWFISWW